MEKRLKIGVCADVHHDLIPDGLERLTAFINEMNKEQVDFIVQLGDFCRPYPHNKPFMDRWNSFSGKKYHVFGNHDTDGGFTPEDVIAFWGASGRYYSFDEGGWHFVVLYGNENRPGAEVEGYPRNISGEQRDWLEADLDKTNLPVVVCNHHGLDLDIDKENGSLKESILIRRILERANEKAGAAKVRLCLSGHWHNDYHNVYNGIHYVQINSMSYQWLGKDWPLYRYDKSLYETYHWFQFTAPYKDPLWAVITFEPNDVITIAGRNSVFVGPSPGEMGVPQKLYPLTASVSDRRITAR